MRSYKNDLHSFFIVQSFRAGSRRMLRALEYKLCPWTKTHLNLNNVLSCYFPKRATKQEILCVKALIIVLNKNVKAHRPVMVNLLELLMIQTACCSMSDIDSQPLNYRPIAKADVRPFTNICIVQIKDRAVV